MGKNLFLDNEVVKEKEVTFKKPKMAYRYYCDSCTGRAFYSEEAGTFFSKVCQNCNTLLKYKAENYIKLDKAEAKQVNEG